MTSAAVIGTVSLVSLVSLVTIVLVFRFYSAMRPCMKDTPEPTTTTRMYTNYPISSYEPAEPADLVEPAEPAETADTPVQSVPMTWSERVERARKLLHQDRIAPSPWRRVGNVHANSTAFHLERRRNRSRRRWEYRIEDRYGVMIDLERTTYDELEHGSSVDVPGYGTMRVQIKDDCVECDFELM